MSRTVIFSFGEGDLNNGFPKVTAQVLDANGYTLRKIQGSLLPKPEILEYYINWHLLYEHFYRYKNWRQSRNVNEDEEDDDIKINEGDITNISVTDFDEIREGFKNCINDWLRSPSFSRINEKVRAELNKNEEIRLIIETENDTLQRLPWHYWDFFDEYINAEIILGTTEYEKPNSIKTNDTKVQILVILGNSSGINTEVDQALLNELENVADLKYLVEPDLNLKNVTENLQIKNWHILFFAGHSSSKEKGKIYVGNGEIWTIERFKYGLKEAINKGLKLAIFNSCDGLGLARDLADLNIPAIIVMRESVPDKVAQAFLECFLKEFSSGQSLYISVRRTREKLEWLENEFPCATWLPVICQNPTVLMPSWQELVEDETELVDNNSNEPNSQREPDIRLSPENSPGANNSDRPINFWHRLGTVFLTSTLVTGLVMGVRSLGILQGLELQAYDQMISSRPQEFPDNRFVIIRITEEDLQLPEQEHRGIGHLSDRALVLLLEKLEPHEPRVIGLDLLRDFKVNTKYRNELANRLRQENFIGICFVGQKSNSGHTNVAAPFQVPSAQIGFNDVVLDKPYNILRRQLLLLDPNTSLCSAWEAFSLKVAEYFLKKEGIVPDSRQGNLQLGKVVLKPLEARSSGYQNLDASGHQVLLNFRSVNGSPLNVTNNQFTLGQILRNKVNLDIIRDKIVLIGVDSATANDYFLTPYKKEIPGVIFHAQMISQILSAVLDQRPLLSVWSFSIEILWVWGWSWISGGLVILLWRSPIKLGILGCVVLSSLYIVCYIFLIPDVGKNLKVSSVWIPFIPPTLSLIITSGYIIMIERRRAIS